MQLRRCSVGGKAMGAVLAAALLCGCGSHGAAPSSKHAALRPAVQAPSPDQDLVTAVAVNAGSSPLEMKFALREHPQPGVAAPLRLVLTPNLQLDRLFATFHGEDGLTVESGQELSVREHPDAGIPISHGLTVKALQPGIYYVSATVLTDAGADSIVRSYRIPVIVGEGLTGDLAANGH